MENEQAKQRASKTTGALDQGLEDSFPASDPVSMVSTGVPSGRADKNEADKVHANADTYTIEPAAAVRKDTKLLLGDLGKLVRENPLTAVGVVAAIAFAYGATR